MPGGIGRGIALGLAQAGADIIALDIGNLEETKTAVEKSGRNCICYHVDLSDVVAIEKTWDLLLENAGKVDILFNNAGMQYRKSILEYPIEMLDKILAVNLKASYIMAQKAGKHFCDRVEKEPGFHGKIVNTASLFSIFGGMEVSGYTCSKHAVVGMTKALSNELAQFGICVNGIAPGYIQTEMTHAIWGDPEKKREKEKRIPAGRWGRSEDLAGVAVFLASSASDYITGTILPIDGGYSSF